MTTLYWASWDKSVAPGRYDWCVVDSTGRLVAGSIAQHTCPVAAARAAQDEVRRRFEERQRREES